MEELLQPILNLGGLGAVCIVLLILHREALASARAEMKETRDAFRDELRAEREECMERHAELLEAIRALKRDEGPHRRGNS